MDNRKFESGASASPPSAPVSPSSGYPTNGNPGTGTPATVPGEWWFHQVGEELRGVITAAGLTPDYTSTVQLLAALSAGWGMPASHGGNGYQTLPGNILLQWGSVSVVGGGNEQVVNVTFPLQFDTVYQAIASDTFGIIHPSSATTEGGRITSLSTTGFTFTMAWDQGQNQIFRWIAIGN